MVALIESLQRARSATTVAEDWCVLRFDRNDRTLEIYWSEPNAPYRNTSASASSAGGAFRPWGGHAEMQLIRDFSTVLANYGQTPNLVEIFQSRSPCGRSPVFTANSINYPEGCGRKLVCLAEQHPAIGEWVVIYDEVFRGNRANPEFNLEAHQMIAHLNAQQRMSTRRFNPFLDR
jgi:hypothetical protein